MSSNAPTLLAPGALAASRPAEATDAHGRISLRTVLATLALLTLVVASLLIVVVAADRPSFLAPSTSAYYYPRWLAGPLGGIWPSLTRSEHFRQALFTYGVIGMYLAYALALAYVPRMRARWAIAAVVAVHVVFLLSPPLSYTDIFNYINYGRMEIVHHMNPYATIPTVEPHSDPAFALSNWHHLLSPYGPLFTILTFALVPLGVAGSLWAMKTILLLVSLGLVALVWHCARLVGRDPVRAIVFTGLNPVVLVWGLGGDHNDFITVFLIMLGVFLLLRARGSGPASHAVPAAADVEVARPPRRGRPRPAQVRAWLWPLSIYDLAGGGALVVAVATKASAAILLPVVVVSLLRSPRRAMQVTLGMSLAGVVVALGTYVAFGAHIPDLSTQGKVVTSESLPNLIGLALGSGGETTALRYALQGVLILSLAAAAVLAWRRREFITPSGWATMGLLATLSWVLPWYVLWVTPLAALARSKLLAGTALAFGVYMILVWVPLAGSWNHAIGFTPGSTTLGKQHGRQNELLLH